MDHLFLKILIGCFLFSLLNLTGGCSKNQAGRNVRKYSDTNVPIKGQAGDRFILVLDSNPTTGYSWKLVVPVDGKILRLIGSEYQAPDSQIPGRGGKEHWTFQAVEKGNTTVKLEYLRPWEKNVSPAKTVAFHVTIE